MRETREKKDIELSSEETNALARSTKKYKDHHDPEGGVRIRDFTIAGFSLKSYKDSLGGEIPGVYEQAFGFVSSMWENDVSDYEEDTYSSPPPPPPSSHFDASEIVVEEQPLTPLNETFG
ncbi:hypothetical protein FCV25MIE_19396 [Fagus crenata]